MTPLTLDQSQSSLCHSAKVGEVVEIWVEEKSIPPEFRQPHGYEKYPDKDGYVFEGTVSGIPTRIIKQHPFGPIGGTVIVFYSRIYYENSMGWPAEAYDEEIIKLKLHSVRVESRDERFGWVGVMERIGG